MIIMAVEAMAAEDAEEAVKETVIDAVDKVVVVIEDKDKVIMKPNVVHNTMDNICGESVQIIGRAMLTKE